MALALDRNYLTYLSKLPTNIQTQANRLLLKYMDDPNTKGLNFEKLKGGSGFYSLRVQNSYRAIVKKATDDGEPILVYIGKHDDAYRWADTHKCEVNPQTGTIQVYETLLDEAPHTLEVPKSQSPKDGLFTNLRERQLRRLGVPENLFAKVYSVRNDDDMDKLESVVPSEVYESLFYFYAGDSYEDVVSRLETPSVPVDPDDFGSALNRNSSRAQFVVCKNNFELESILNQPLAHWRTFLHPDQRRLIERTWNGPVRVLGSAGTGKTVVAIHRAKYLAQQLIDAEAEDSTLKSKKILFVTFVKTLSIDIEQSLRSICTPEQIKRIEVSTLDSWVDRYVKGHGFKGRHLFDRDEDHWAAALERNPEELDYTKEFLNQELEQVVLAKNVQTRKDYLSVSRVGRGVRLNRNSRAAIWPVFDEYLTLLRRDDLKENPMFYFDAIALLKQNGVSKYASVIADEIQDFEAYKLELIRALVPEQPNDLFLVGDGHQRIFMRNPVVLGRHGINIRGRGRKLLVNYRTTKEIKEFATRVLAGVDYDDLDGGVDQKTAIMSMTNGPAPEIVESEDSDAQYETLSSRIHQLIEEGVEPRNICVVARTNNRSDRASKKLDENGIDVEQLSRSSADIGDSGDVRCMTAHRVKGLEFDYIFLVGCDDDMFPLPSMIKDLSGADLSRALITERSLLYVIASRAKRGLVVMHYKQPSLFLSEAIASQAGEDSRELENSA